MSTQSNLFLKREALIGMASPTLPEMVCSDLSLWLDDRESRHGTLLDVTVMTHVEVNRDLAR